MTNNNSDSRGCEDEILAPEYEASPESEIKPVPQLKSLLQTTIQSEKPTANDASIQTYEFTTRSTAETSTETTDKETVDDQKYITKRTKDENVVDIDVQTENLLHESTRGESRTNGDTQTIDLIVQPINEQLVVDVGLQTDELSSMQAQGCERSTEMMAEDITCFVGHRGIVKLVDEEIDAETQTECSDTLANDRPKITTDSTYRRIVRTSGP